MKWLIPVSKFFLVTGIWHIIFYGKALSQKKSESSRAYYINLRGDDHQDGSILHPWRTFIPVNHLCLKRGDSVLFQGGQSFSGTLIIDSGDCGNAIRPVLISSYGSGPATIQAGDSSAIILYKTNYFSIRNLHLVGAGRKRGNIRAGLAIINSRHIDIESLDIAGFQKAGLLVHSSSHILIMHVYAHENGAAGIEVGGINGEKDCNHLYIAYCKAEDNPGDPSNLTNHSGNGIVVGNCRNVTIEYCTATNNGWDMPRIGNGPVGIWAYEADHVIIQHCLSYRNKTSAGGADGGGFDLDGGVTNSVIQYCLSYENQGAGYCIYQYYYASPWHDNVFRYNISENDGNVSDAGAGLYVWNSSRDEKLFYNCLVYNNTIYNVKGAALCYSELSKRKNFSFFNNIFVGRDSLVKGERGVDIFRDNNWWSQVKGGREMNAEKLSGFSVDPSFENPGRAEIVSASALKSFDQYRVPANSSLLKIGLDLNKSYRIRTGNLDFNGRVAILNGIGACF